MRAARHDTFHAIYDISFTIHIDDQNNFINKCTWFSLNLCHGVKELVKPVKMWRHMQSIIKTQNHFFGDAKRRTQTNGLLKMKVQEVN